MQTIFITNVRTNVRNQIIDDEVTTPLPDPEPLMGEPFFPMAPSKPVSRVDLMLEALGHDTGGGDDDFEEIDDEAGHFVEANDLVDVEPLDLTDGLEGL